MVRAVPGRLLFCKQPAIGPLGIGFPRRNIRKDARESGTATRIIIIDAVRTTIAN